MSPGLNELDRDAFFEGAYSHFAEPGVWDLYPEVNEVLTALHDRFDLAVIQFRRPPPDGLRASRYLEILLPRLSFQ